MKVQVSLRKPDEGGAKDGTPEVHVGDPDGIDMQLQDKSYCGGGGALGNDCRAVEPAPKKGLIARKAFSDCTVFATDAQRPNAFYRELFGIGHPSYPWPTRPT